MLGVHHEVPDARSRTVLVPVLAYLGAFAAAPAARPGSRASASFSLPLATLLSSDTLAWATPAFGGDPGGPLFRWRTPSGAHRTLAGAHAAVLHAALRVAAGRRGGAVREALYGPALREARGERLGA